MINRWILGGAVLGGLALGGLVYSFFRGKKAHAADIDAKSKALKKAYDAGCVDGKADALADSGKVHNPRPLLNFSEKADEQQQNENGYNDCYEFHWKAPPKSDVIKDATPSSGGPKSSGMTACQYGESRGRSAGMKAADDGLGGDAAAETFKANLETDGSKKRQAESGNAADYRRCYLNGAASAYAARLLKIAAAKVLGGSVTGYPARVGTHQTHVHHSRAGTLN